MDTCSPYTCRFTQHENYKGEPVRDCYACVAHGQIHVCGDERLPHPSRYVGSQDECLITGRDLASRDRKETERGKSQETTPEDPRYVFHVHETDGLEIELNLVSAAWGEGEACLDAHAISKARLYVDGMNAKVRELFTPQLYARMVTGLLNDHDLQILLFVKAAEGWVKRLSSVIQRCYAYVVALLDLAVNAPAPSTVDAFEVKLRDAIDLTAGMIVDRMARHHNVESAEKVLDVRAPYSVSEAHGNLSVLIMGDLTRPEGCLPYSASFDGTTDPARSRNSVKERIFRDFYAPSCTRVREISSTPCPPAERRGNTRR